MDDKILKFNQKLKDLLAYAKKKNNILEQQEVISFFSDVNLTLIRQIVFMNFLKKAALKLFIQLQNMRTAISILTLMMMYHWMMTSILIK